MTDEVKQERELMKALQAKRATQPKDERLAMQGDIVDRWCGACAPCGGKFFLRSLEVGIFPIDTYRLGGTSPNFLYFALLVDLHFLSEREGRAKFEKEQEIAARALRNWPGVWGKGAGW